MIAMKRFLFLGPTGVGKSSVINILYNDNVDKESMKEPAVVAATTNGVTKEFTTYYNNKCAYTDSIGFGDDRFTADEIVTLLKQLIENALIGYNRIYLCIQYGRISKDIRLYLDLIISVFGDGCFNWCSIIFTHCTEENMNKEIFSAKNQNDTEIIQLIKKVENVIFGDLQLYEGQSIDSWFKDRRKCFLDSIKLDTNNSSAYPYFSQPNDPSSWLSSICNVIELFAPIKVPTEEIWAYIKSVRIVKVQNIHFYGECTICRDAMYHTNSVYTTCRHCFHRRCIATWSYESPTCPVCREPYSLMELKPWLPSQMSLYRPK